MTWNLTPEDPLALRLAADVRCGPTDYADDQIWELDLSTLTLSTRYGGRGHGSWQIEHSHTPRLRHFFPNLLHTAFITAAGQSGEALFWAVDSHTVALWLRPAGITTVRLSAAAAGLAPTLLSDPAGERHVLCSLPQTDAARAHAAAVLARNWADDVAHLHRLNAATPHITTGDPDWDAAFAFAYKVSLQSYVGPTSHLPHPSFIFTRIPERGYSPRGDGTDHNWQWDGQVATEAYVNLPIVAAAAPELAQGVIRNYLAVQQPDGFIDWKPGLAGQRNGHLCIPLLAAATWRIYEQTLDLDFLRDAASGLNRFLERWYTPAQDRDQDGVPEWDNTIQSAFDDQPTFGRYRDWAQQADVSKVESPDLMAYLYREHRAMQQIEAALGWSPHPQHEARAQHLQAELAGMWRDATRSYHFRDRDSHAMPTHARLVEMESETGLTAVSQPVAIYLPQPNRVLVRLAYRDPPPPLLVTVEGINRDGWSDSETMDAEAFSWHRGLGSATGQTLWQAVERVHVTGMQGRVTRLELLTPDLSRQDQTLLLPLWARMVPAERARQLVKRTITDPTRYWRWYGMPNCAAQDRAYRADNREGSGGVWLMWNTMIGEGLVENGYRAEAAELVRRLMTAMIHTLKAEKCFREAYNADRLEGLGDRDYLWGVAPCALFLQLVGIRITPTSTQERQVYISGYNPFPWPVTVRHLGVTVTRPPGQERTAEVATEPGISTRIVYAL
ncbi:MAG: hypothetical protein Fur0021_35350 [Candidatus Promineifilaceae bacterium]